MPSNPLTQSELNDYAIGRILTPLGELAPYMPPGYFLATHYLNDSPAVWRLFDASYIQSGTIDPNRLGTGSTGAGSLYLADDGTWKLISGAPGIGDMLKATYDVDNDGTVDSAERIEIIVRNSTGTTLTKGTVVYLSGATGNRPNALRAQADTEATSSKTFGIVVADINNNADGYVACNGTLHDLDTSAFADGAALWLSAATAGAYTSTIPAEPNHTVFIGYIARSHPTQGRLVILIQNGYELNELHGVLISSEANNDLLVYESSTTLWKNKSISTIFGGTPLVAVPTLAQVTTAGNTTTNAITVSQLFTNTAGSYGNTSIAGYHIGLTNTVGYTGGITLTSDGALRTLSGNRKYIFYTDSTTQVGFMGSSKITSWNSALRFGTSFGTDDWMTLFTTGNVAIGTTTDAGYKLDVNGTVRVSNNNATHTLLSNTAGTRTVSFNATANMDMTLSHGSIYLIGNTGYGFLQVGNTKISSTEIAGFNSFLLSTAGDNTYMQSRTGTVSNIKFFTGSNGTGTANKGTLLVTDYANFAITPEQSAQLQIESTTKGVLFPRMTNTQVLAIVTPATGLQAYDTTNNKNLLYNGTVWQNIATESWVSGQGYLTSTPTLAQVTTAGNTTTNAITVGGLTSNGSITAASLLARGVFFNNTLVAAANSDVLIGLDINPTFTRSSFTTVSSYALRISNSDALIDNGTTHGLIINSSQTAGAGLGGAVKYGVQIIGSGNFNRNVGTAVYGLHIPSYSGSVYSDYKLGAYIADRVSIGTNDSIGQGVSLLTIGNNTDYTTYNNNPNTIYLKLASNTNDLTAGIYGGQNMTNVQAGIFFTRGIGNGVGFIDFVTANSNVTGTLNARIFGSGNLLIQSGGTFTDAGYKLDVNGTVRVQGDLYLGSTTNVFQINKRGGTTASSYLTLLQDGNNRTFTFYQRASIFGAAVDVGMEVGAGFLTLPYYQALIGAATTTSNAKLISTGSITASTALAHGVYFNNTLVAAANNDVLVGLDITPNFTNGAFTGVKNVALRTNGLVVLGTSAYTYGSTYTSGAKLTIENTGGNNGLAINNGAGTYQFSIKTTTSDNIGIQFYWSDGNTNSFFQHANNLGTIVGQITTPVTLKGQYTALGYAIGYGVYAEGMRVAVTTGNILINTTTDAGEKLQVVGDIRISNGRYKLGGAQVGLYATSDLGLTVNTGSGNSFLGYYPTGDTSYLGTTVTLGRLSSVNLNATSGLQEMVRVTGNYAPTSGTGLFTALQLSNTINQTGGANGITRGIYINPTLTAAADFRAIETTAGKVIIGGSITAASAIARGVYFNNTLVAAANNDVLVGLDIQPAFTNGAFTGVSNVALRVKGAGATSATTALLVQNSTPADIFTIANDGSALFDLITSGSAVVIRRKATPTSRLIEFLSSGGARFFTYDQEASPNANGDDGAWLFKGRHRRAANSGIASAFRIEPFFAQEQFDTIQLNSIHIVPNIFISGTATNVTVRGIYYNPTIVSLTGVVAHRAIETTSGNIVFNGGNVLIGTSIDSGYKLDVIGDINTTTSYRVGGVAGWTGIINIVGNPPGQQNVHVSGGIITNVT